MKFTVSLHRCQQDIFYSNARFKVVACGRRFGKSILAAYMCILEAIDLKHLTYFRKQEKAIIKHRRTLAGNSNGAKTIWVVSPSYSQSNVIWTMIKRMVPMALVDQIKEGDRCIIFKNGSTIWAKTGEKPDNLRGDGLDFVVIDECAMVRREAWIEAIRPALADKFGGAMLISSPKGKNWYYETFLMGENKEDKRCKDYAAFRYSSYDNPFLDPNELKELQYQLPEEIYNQEILAKFIANGGEVFRNIEECTMDGILSAPYVGRQYVMGVDLAKVQDFTVIFVADVETNAVVYMERFNDMDWKVQRARIKEVHQDYNRCQVYIDSTGIGDPIYEELLKDGVPVIGIKFSSVSKPMIIQKLQLMFQNREILIPNEPTLIGELEAYGYSMTAQGHIQYSAPKGKHDDCVCALALVAQGLVSKYARGLVGFISALSTKSKYAKKEQSSYNDIPRVGSWDEAQSIRI